MAESQVAVLIDYENVGLADMRSLLDQVSDVGRIIIKRAYADWSRPVAQKGKQQLLDLGIEAVHYFHTARSGKNSSDIYLAIDAVELLHKSPVDTFVIVSADTDFVPLVGKLRAAGKTVIGSGRRAIVAAALVRSCDRYIYLEDPTTSPLAASPLAVPVTTEHPITRPGEDASSLLLRVLKASSDVQGEVLGSKLHQTMQRIDPSFDYKALGYRSFIQFLEQAPAISLSRPRGGGDVIVRLQPTSPRMETRQVGADDSPLSWELQIHQAWSARAKVPGDSISGSMAASEAARALGAPKLSVSPYKTLQKLLDASEMLRANWTRQGNALTRQD